MTEKQAHIYSAAAAKRLKEKLGGDWQADVWDNLGWACKVTLGSISCYPRVDRKSEKLTYSTFINQEQNRPSGGLAMWHNEDNTSNLPEKSVLKAMEEAKDVVYALMQTLNDNAYKMNKAYKFPMRVIDSFVLRGKYLKLKRSKK